MSITNITIIFLVLCSNVSGFLVISASNAVYSVLYLILVFLFNTIILISLGTEFLALIFLIVYVGAIAVLFLFVVMMLNIKGSKRKKSNLYNFFIYTLIFSFITIICLYNITYLDNIYFLKKIKELLFLSFSKENFTLNLDILFNINLLGQIIYTNYFIHFIIAGIVLLEAMIGAIILTMVKHREIKRQNIFTQVSRDFRNAVFLTNL